MRTFPGSTVLMRMRQGWFRGKYQKSYRLKRGHSLLSDSVRWSVVPFLSVLLSHVSTSYQFSVHEHRLTKELASFPSQRTPVRTENDNLWPTRLFQLGYKAALHSRRFTSNISYTFDVFYTSPAKLSLSCLRQWKDQQPQ